MSNKYKPKTEKKIEQSALKKWDYTQKKKIRQMLSSLRTVLVNRKNFQMCNFVFIKRVRKTALLKCESKL